MKAQIALFSLFLAATGVSTAQDKLSGADKAFAQKAAIGGLMEVEMGQMATEKASDPKVKEFGQRMVTDHGKANSELQSLASKKSLTLPSAPDGKHKAKATKMSKLSGAEFDRAYMKDMVEDHEKDVAEFQKEADSGSDADLKSWAATTLPTLREHLQMAKDTASKVGAGGGKTSSMSSGTGSTASGNNSGSNSGSSAGNGRNSSTDQRSNNGNSTTNPSTNAPSTNR